MATMEIEQRSKMKIEFFGIRWLQGFIRLWVDATLMKEEISEQLGFTPHYLKYLLKNDLKLYKLSLWDNRTEQLACRVVSSASDNDSQLVA